MNTGSKYKLHIDFFHMSFVFLFHWKRSIIKLEFKFVTLVTYL